MQFYIKRKTLFFVLIIFALVEPNYFKVVSNINRLYTVAQYVIGFYIILLLFIRMKKGIKRGLFKYVLLIFIFWFIPTALAGINISAWFNNCLRPLELCLLIILFDTEQEKNDFMEAFAQLDIYIYINLFTVFMFPNGLYHTDLYTDCWFLGYKNPQIRLILPILIINMCYSQIKYGKLSRRVIFDIVASFLTMIFIDSSAGMVGFVIFIGGYIFFANRSFFIDKVMKRFFDYKIILPFLTVIFLMLVWNGNRSNDYIQYIAELFGKGTSFFTRVDFWNRTVDLIIKKPIWGYGYLTGANYVSLLGNIFASHPHNYVLYLLTNGGIVFFSIIAYVYVSVFRRAAKSESFSIRSIAYAYLIAILCMGFVESLTEFVLLYPSHIFLLSILENEKKNRKFGVIIKES